MTIDSDDHQVNTKNNNFRAKPVYIGGQLVYCIGMIFMAWTRTKWGVLLFSWSAGVM